MDVKFTLKTAVLEIEDSVDNSKFISGLEEVEDYAVRFKPSFLILSSPDFSIGSLEYTYKNFFQWLDAGNVKFVERVDKLLKHLTSLAVTNCPIELLKVIDNLFENDVARNGRVYLVPALARIIEKLPYEEQIAHLPSFQRYLLSSPIDVVGQVPDSMWVILRDNLSEDDISALLIYLTKSYSVAPGLILSQKNLPVFSRLILLSADLEYVLRFMQSLKGKPFGFDIIPLIARAVDTLNLDTCNDQRYAIKLLDILLDGVTEENKDIFQPAWSRVQAKLDDEHWKYKHEALKVLVKAESLGLYSYESLSVYFEFDNVSQQKFILKAMLNHLSDEKTRNQLFDLLREITAKRDPEPLAAAIRCFISKFEDLNEIDSTQTREIFARFFIPLPCDPRPQEALAELLIHMEADVQMRQNVESFIYFCCNFEKSDRMVDHLLELIEKYQLAIDYARIDWFGPSRHTSYGLLPEHDPGFVLDLLSYSLVDPDKAGIVLKKLAGCAEMSSPIAFTTCVSVLTAIVSAMGVDISSELSTVGIKTSPASYEWFPQEEIEALFKQIQVPLDVSDYGHLIRHMLEATAKLAAAAEVIGETELWTLLFLCLKLGTAFPGPTASIVAQLHDSMVINNSEKDKERYLREEDRFFHQFLPMTESGAVAKALIHCIGEDKALADFKPIILDAVSKHVDLAKKLQSKIEQPVFEMRTFLYFQDEQHADWRAQCRKRFPFSDWILQKIDCNLVGELPEIDNVELLDPVHQFIYHRISDPNFKDIAREDSEWAHGRLSSFEFNFESHYEIKKGLSIRESDPSLYSTISFLWHSTSPLPSAITPEALEELALNNADNLQLAIGYLMHAKKNEWRVDIQKWTEVLKVSPFNDISIYCAALLLLCVKLDRTGIPDYLQQFIDKTLDKLGFYLHDARSIISYFQKETGMKWQFVRSVISLDLKSYTACDPLVISEFTNVNEAAAFVGVAMEKLHSSTVTIEEMQKIVSGFSVAFMFNPTDMISYRLLPTSIPLHPRLLSFLDTTQMQRPLIFGSGMIDGLLTVLKGKEQIPSSMVTFLLNLATNPKQYEIVLGLMTLYCKKDVNWPRMTLAREQELMETYTVIGRFLENKPPSFTRGALRAVWKNWKATIQLKKRSDIKEMLQFNPSHYVHPALCYRQLGRVGMEPWKSATNLTSLRLGIRSGEIVKAVADDMFLCSSESIEEFMEITAVAAEIVEKMDQWKTADEMKISFAKALLKTAVSHESHLVFANAVFAALIQRIPLVQLAKLVISEEFVNLGLASCVVLIFRKLEAYIVKAEMEEDVALAVKFHNSRSGKIQDESLMEIFADVTNPKCIAMSLSYVSEKQKEELWPEVAREK